MSKPKPDPIFSRRKHTNSKLGCTNCKKKKIRCDENLPICDNCNKGKKGACSYLSLNQAELNRIRITHSLRNSQNKLLQEDYKLPTSSTTNRQLKNWNNQNNLIEFQHELTNLPIITPNIKYDSLQFDNITVEDYAKIEELAPLQENIKGPKEASYKVPIEEPKEANHKVLPNGFVKFLTVKKLSHEVTNGTTKKSTKVDEEISKQTLLVNFKQYFEVGAQKYVNFSLTFDSFYMIGLSTIEKMFVNQKESISIKTRFKVTSVDFLGKVLQQLKVSLKREASGIEMSNKIPLDQTNNHAMGYVSFLFYFYFDLEFGQYYEMSQISLSYFVKWVAHSNETKQDFSFHFSSLLWQLQYNIASIQIPSYDPEFLKELYLNIQDLNDIYNSKSIPLKEEHLTKKYEEQPHTFNCLLDFFQNDLLPILFIQRDEEYVCTYPEATIFNIFKKWNKIFPSNAITYNPEPNDSHDYQFIQDLTTTLYTYYIAMSAGLEAVFPTCKYLFTASFMTPTSDFFKNKRIMTPSRDNIIFDIFKPDDISEKLQKHNYLCMRVYAFFKGRFMIYQDYIEPPKSVENKVNGDKENGKNIDRFKSRVLRGVIEVQVKSFNTTLIRPEHYPRLKDTEDQVSKENAYFAKALYTRNIEKLDLFYDSNLQYDYETMLFLKDYRRLKDDRKPKVKKVEMEDIIAYYIDRNFILGNIFPNE